MTITTSNANKIIDPWMSLVLGEPIKPTFSAMLNLDRFKDSIKKVEFYPPSTKVTFVDGEVITVAARHEDEFNEEVGVMHCILKRIFGGTGYNTMIRNLIKDTHKREAAELLKKEEERKAKEAEKKAKEEAREKERKRLVREREEKIEIQKEAYLRAMKEMNALSCDQEGNK